MAVRSTRLGDLSFATGGAGATSVIYTVPANRTAIVKEIRLFLAAAAAFPASFDLDVLYAVGVNRPFARRASAALGELTPITQASLTLLEGDSLRIVMPANVTIQGYVSGALLAGDPA